MGEILGICRRANPAPRASTNPHYVGAGAALKIYTRPPPSRFRMNAANWAIGMPSKKIVFFFPAFSSQEATAPLGILAVATPLLRAGYEVCIVDSTITPNFQKR